MAERIEIELDELTSAYLNHYAQRWHKDLSEAATIWSAAYPTEGLATPTWPGFGGPVIGEVSYDGSG